MEGAPRVTVLMPVYNGADYLDDSIDSILSQTLQDFEFLIINDGSRDASLDILRARAAQDARIRLVDQPNMGLAAALNKGLQLASGDLVARQDQDDLSLPKRLQHQVEWMRANPECVLLGTRATIIEGRTPTQRMHDHPVDNCVLKLDLFFNNPFVHSSVMLRRDVVLEIGGYSTDPQRQPPEDYELWSRLARSGRVANLSEALLAYREVQSSMSRTGVNPFQAKLVKLCAENVAHAAGLDQSDQNCRDIASLMHQSLEGLSWHPDLAAMEAVLQAAFDRVAKEVGSDGELQAFRARCAYWLDNLRHHFGRQVVKLPFAAPQLRPHEGPAPAAPEVTVLMPVYNGAAMVAQAIETILGQTFTNFEFLIINDGSRDGTQAILDRYAARDARIRVVQQENMGLAATLNKGLGLARGEFVARQDHDDLAAPDRLKRQLQWMRMHPPGVLVGTWATIWTDQGSTDRAHDHAVHNAAVKVDLLFDNPLVHSAVMFRREATRVLGGYTTDPERQPPEDYELWCRLARVGQVANIPEYLLVYREVPGSITRTGVHPFRKRLVLLCAENLAHYAGLDAPDRHCRDAAALLHHSSQDWSFAPNLWAMRSVLRRSFDRIAQEIGSDEERAEFEARSQYWNARLTSLYVHLVLQPAWAQPFTSAGYRRVRGFVRKIRTFARKVMG